jgi:large subunit ribosomal protein L18
MLVKSVRSIQRNRRRLRIRSRITGTVEKPRLAVFRTHKHIYAQLIDDLEGKTLLGMSTLSAPVKEKIKYGGNIKAAEALGHIVADEAKKLNIEKIVFDRAGYQYHGRIKAFAEAARSKGLHF